jgi:hypothetical protein
VLTWSQVYCENAGVSCGCTPLFVVVDDKARGHVALALLAILFVVVKQQHVVLVLPLCVVCCAVCGVRGEGQN